MKNLIIRSAEGEDAASMAKLLYSTEDNPELEWGQGSKSEILERLETLVRDPNNRYSYKYAKVAIYEDKVCGVILAFPAYKFNELNKSSSKLLLSMQKGLKNTILYFFETIIGKLIKECEIGEFYISNIATDENHRGIGIGRILMGEGEKLAKSYKLNKCSLLAKDKFVMKFYNKLSYEFVKTESLLNICSYNKMVKIV